MIAADLQVLAAPYCASALADDDPQATKLLLGEYARALVQIASEGSDVDVEVGPDPLPWATLWRPELARLQSTVVAAREPAILGEAIAALLTEPEETGVAWCEGWPIAVLSAWSGPVPPGREVIDGEAAGLPLLLTDAAALVADACPAYLPWVGRAIRCIVPVDAPGGERLSATVEQFPGLVFLSTPKDAVEAAARLVHEASHQYYFALERASPLHDGSDEKEYFSPVKRRGRSIDRILFAFHAFGNGELLDRALQRWDPSIRVTNGTNLEGLRLHREHLAATGALTETGHALWKPLAELLFTST